MTIDTLDLLKQHQTLGAAPASEHEWLVRHAERRHYAAGTNVVPLNGEANEMFVLFTGRVVVYFEHGAGRRHTMESREGSVTGLLPYSRLKGALGDVVVEEPTDLLALHRDLLPEMIRECPVITETLVHSMVDRARRFSSINFQDEKIQSLGRLAAGLAHELNNPASAAARSALLLDDAQREVGDAAFALGQCGLTQAQLTRIRALVAQRADAAAGGVPSPLERADREDELSTWLESHQAEPSCAHSLGEGGVTLTQLDDLADVVSGPALDAAIRWIAAARSANMLAAEVERATTRIRDLVASVKRFTYVDRGAGRVLGDLKQGLSDVVAVLAAKARGKSVAVRLEIEPDLPMVEVGVAEINQVWANLLENAIDAVPEGGNVTVRAEAVPGAVCVQFIDNGPGIPPEVQERMFDPFFTTKKIGEGTGLGLDIARRVVLDHNGGIEVETAPGRTEFRVRIPVADSAGRPAT